MTKRQMLMALDEFDMDEELDMNEIEFVLHFREHEQIPRTYAEIEYDDFDDPEAIMGARFDDMNYLRYRERQEKGEMNMWWQSDICWCADSNRCTNTECFRHLANKNDEEKIFTCGALMDTEYCPMSEKGEN